MRTPNEAAAIDASAAREAAAGHDLLARFVFIAHDDDADDANAANDAHLHDGQCSCQIRGR